MTRRRLSSDERGALVALLYYGPLPYCAQFRALHARKLVTDACHERTVITPTGAYKETIATEDYALTTRGRNVARQLALQVLERYALVQSTFRHHMARAQVRSHFSTPTTDDFLLCSSWEVGTFYKRRLGQETRSVRMLPGRVARNDAHLAK